MGDWDIANDLRLMADSRCVSRWDDLRDAADEIQRLRDELAGVRRHFLQVEAALSDIEHLTSDRNVLHRIKEARRG